MVTMARGYPLASSRPSPLKRRQNPHPSKNEECGTLKIKAQPDDDGVARPSMAFGQDLGSFRLAFRPQGKGTDFVEQVRDIVFVRAFPLIRIVEQ